MKYKSVSLSFGNRYRNERVVSLEGIALLFLGMAFALFVTSRFVVAHANGFTDIFYTNSFRGSFEWVKKMDWLGMVVQAVISVFSLVGVSLIVIRIMTSLLYLSAKGLWEEVHDLKQSGGESEMYDLGLVNMAKSWAKGKAGTGLDAILGAILVLLPDVKRYSDFGEKSGTDFGDDVSISQYMLKISLPTVLAVFFLAMGFNGTLVKGLATTVDAMGTLADKAVSVNYAGFVDDLVNSNTGYKFTFDAIGTNEGSLKQSLAKDIYGRVASRARGASAAQLQMIGQKVEEKINGSDGLAHWISKAYDNHQISDEINTGLTGSGGTDGVSADHYYDYLTFEVIVNTSESGGQDCDIKISDLLDGTGLAGDNIGQSEYLHIYIRQKQSAGGTTNYFNVDG